MLKFWINVSRSEPFLAGEEIPMIHRALLFFKKKLLKVINFLCGLSDIKDALRV